MASSHSQTLPPNAARQLQGGIGLPSSVNPLGFRQMYQSRLALSLEERDSLNHLCWSEVLGYTRVSELRSV